MRWSVLRRDVLACGASEGRVGHVPVVRTWWVRMRTALALRVGLAGGKKCVHGRDVMFW